MTIPFDPIAHADIAAALYDAHVRRVARAARLSYECIYKWLKGKKAMRETTFNQMMVALRQIGPYQPANPKQAEYNRHYYTTVRKRREYQRAIGQAPPAKRTRQLRAGERYGKAVIMKRLRRTPGMASRTIRYRCRCDCGREIILRSTDLRTRVRAGCWQCTNMKRYTQ